MSRIIEWFFKGLLFVVPLAVTGYVSYRIFFAIDKLLIQNLPYPGLGVVITLAGITLLGALASSFLSAWIFRLLDGLMVRLPLVKLLYTSVKDLMQAFVGDKNTFDKPVAVSLFPDSGTKMIGFITDDDASHLGLEGAVAVYFPQSYNFAGNLLLVPKSQIEPLSADATRVMTFLVSGGISGKPTEAGNAA